MTSLLTNFYRKKDALDVESHEDYKQLVQIILKEKPKQVKESYDGPKDVNKVDLALLGEDPHPMYIATNLDPKEEELFLASLRGPSLSQSTYHVLRRGPLPWPKRTAKEIENQVAN